MIIFYSGSRSKCVSPEDLLSKEKTAGFMLTYSNFYNRKSSEAIRRFKSHRKKVKECNSGKRKKGKSSVHTKLRKPT